MRLPGSKRLVCVSLTAPAPLLAAASVPLERVSNRPRLVSSGSGCSALASVRETAYRTTDGTRPADWRDHSTLARAEITPLTKGSWRMTGCSHNTSRIFLQNDVTEFRKLAPTSEFLVNRRLTFLRQSLAWSRPRHHVRQFGLYFDRWTFDNPRCSTSNPVESPHERDQSFNSLPG